MSCTSTHTMDHVQQVSLRCLENCGGSSRHNISQYQPADFSIPPSAFH